MSAVLASGYQAIADSLERNIFTTPTKKIAGWTAVALTAGSVGTFYLGFPAIPREYGHNMALTCGKHVFTFLDQLPNSLHFVNATQILHTMPKTDNSCLVSLGTYFGRIALNSITAITIPILSWRKVFQIAYPKEKLD